RAVGHRPLLAGIRCPNAARSPARFRPARSAFRRTQGLRHAADPAVDGSRADRPGLRRSRCRRGFAALVSIPFPLHYGTGPGGLLRVAPVSRAWVSTAYVALLRFDIGCSPGELAGARF